MKETKNGFFKIYNISNKTVARIAGALIVILMFYTVADVIGQLIFDKAIYGVNEISGLMLVLIIGLGLSYTQNQGANIRVQAFDGRLSPTVLKISDIFILTVGFACSVLLVWATGKKAIPSVQLREVAISSSAIPVYPGRVILTIGLALLAFEFLICIIKQFTVWRGDNQ